MGICNFSKSMASCCSAGRGGSGVYSLLKNVVSLTSWYRA